MIQKLNHFSLQIAILLMLPVYYFQIRHSASVLSIKKCIFEDAEERGKKE